MINPQDQFLDFYRSTLRSTSDATRVSLESAARLRKMQLACIDEALVTHERVVAELNAATDISSLIAASGELAGAQYQTLLGYWQGIYEAVSVNQAEVARLVQSQVEQFRDEIPEALGAAPSVPPALAALKPLMEVASSAYALTARATAEATRLAAKQLASANANARPPRDQSQSQSQQQSN